MERMITDHSLNTLKVRAGKLAFATEALAALFDEEGIRLNRIDQVARLKKLHAAIMEHMEKAKSDEHSDSGDYAGKKLAFQLAGIVTGYYAKTPNDNWSKTSRALSGPPDGGDPPFGTVLIRIGPGGVPDAVDVINISRLARESHRKEQEVINDMKKANSRLLSEDKFRGLLAWLAEEVLAGRRSLPFLPPITVQIQQVQWLNSGQQGNGYESHILSLRKNGNRFE